MLGVLVFGDNHLIVRGPLPGRAIAIALVRHWSVIQIGAVTPPPLARWSIVNRAFREDLEWAVVAPGDGEMSEAATALLRELSARGVAIHDARCEAWETSEPEPNGCDSTRIE